MNPDTISFDSCNLTSILKIIDKETQTGRSFIAANEDSKSSVKSGKSGKSGNSNKLPLPRDLDTDDCIKVYSFCQILQDPECPKSVTLIKDSVIEETRSHSNTEDAVANRYRYCREVIKPFLKDYPQDCPDSEERLIQDAISAASEDFPDYQPCYEFFPTSKAFAGKTNSSDSEKRTSLGLIDRSCPEKPIVATPKGKTCEKKSNTEATSKKKSHTEATCKKESSNTGAICEKKSHTKATCKKESSNTEATCEKKSHTEATCKKNSHTEATCKKENSNTEATCENQSHTEAPCKKQSHTEATCKKNSHTEATCKKESSNTEATCEKKSHTGATCKKESNPEATCKKSFEKAQRCGKVDKATHCTPKSSKSSCKNMDNHKECHSSKSSCKNMDGECSSKSSKTSLKRSCPGIPVKDSGSPTQVCTTNECPTTKDPNKSCPLRDCPPKPCPLKDCPPDVCPPKKCEQEKCPPEHCPEKKCPRKECPVTDGPPPYNPAKCPSLDCKNKTKSSSESSSKTDCHSKMKSSSDADLKDDGKECRVRTEKSKSDVCDNRSISSLDMKKMMQAHNETLATLKIAMEDFLGKVYKTTQEAVATITNESTKQIQKYKKCESSNTGDVGENKSAETITSFNFVREVESKDKSDDDDKSSKDKKKVANQIIRKVESTISVVSETVVDKIPDKLKPTHKFNDTSSDYDNPESPKKVSNEIIQDPTPVVTNNVFTSIKTKICSIFCESDEKKEKSVSKKSSTSCTSGSSKKEDDDKLIEKLIE